MVCETEILELVDWSTGPLDDGTNATFSQVFPEFRTLTCLQLVVLVNIKVPRVRIRGRWQDKIVNISKAESLGVEVWDEAKLLEIIGSA